MLTSHGTSESTAEFSYYDSNVAGRDLGFNDWNLMIDEVWTLETCMDININHLNTQTDDSLGHVL